MLDLVCELCGSAFQRMRRRRFCSYHCAGVVNGAKTSIRRGNPNPSYGVSPQCREAWKAKTGTYRGPNSPNFKGFGITRDGYRTISVAKPDGHWRQRLEHVVIAEKALGRQLRKAEVVHHIDGDRQNNSQGNLLICTTGSHRWLHEQMARRYQIEHFRTGGGGHAAAAGFVADLPGGRD